MVSTADVEYVGGGAAIGAGAGYLWKGKTGTIIGALLGAALGWLTEKYLPPVAAALQQAGGTISTIPKVVTSPLVEPVSVTYANAVTGAYGSVAQAVVSPVLSTILQYGGQAVNTIIADGESLLKGGGLLSYLKI